MGITTLMDVCDEQQVRELVSICKSGSGHGGRILRSAHKTLGEQMGALVAREKGGNRYAVIIMMRAGLMFGLGVADGLETSGRQAMIFFSSLEMEIPEGFAENDFDIIILVDAVIESGNSILGLASKIRVSKNIVFMTNVLSCKAVDKFTNLDIYAVRLSQVSYKGARQNTIHDGKGPDTGERLFGFLGG